MTLSRVVSVGVGLVILTAAFVVAKHLYDQHVIADAVAARDAKAQQVVMDSLTRLEHVERAALDSAKHAGRATAVHLATIGPRITLDGPTVIAVDTSARHPAVPGSAPAPTLLVSVPSEVTDLIATQARRIADLESQLAIAERGWTHADSALAAAGMVIRDLRRAQPHWYSRVMCGPGYGLTYSRRTGQVADGPTVGCVVRL